MESEQKKRFSTVEKGWGKGFVHHPVFVKEMLKPHFWGAWFSIFILCFIVNILPAAVSLFLGRCLGRLMGRILPARKYVLKRNLELAFPDMDESSRKKLAHKVQ